MAYDEFLAMRFRECLGNLEGVSEKRMMGGVCFLLHGNMIGGADRQKDGLGRFMFRVGKDNEAEALEREGAAAMIHGGRKMGGMIFVDEKYCEDSALKAWTELSLSFVKTLPPK